MKRFAEMLNARNPVLRVFGILLLAALPCFPSKTMVIFTGGTDTIRSISAIDSLKFTGISPSYNLAIHKGTANSPVSFADIDSIRFYDGTAKFTPQMLYNGYQASPMLLGPNNAFVTLDLRNLSTGFTGEIITDAIDFLDTGNAGVSTQGALSGVTIATQAVIPGGAGITLYYKTGNSYFSETGWTSWTAAPGISGDISGLSGRYMKLRFVLSTNSKSALPAIANVALYANYAGLSEFIKATGVSAYQNERIITGPYAFGFETRDNTAVKNFTTNNNLASVISAKTDEFDKFYALTDWCARRTNDRNYSWNPYPWDIAQVFTGSGAVRGHCMSYAEVLITGLTGLGYYARHWAMEGYGSGGPTLPNDHEVVEAWSNKYKKWVYLDPSLDTYYADPITHTPLSILEMHNIFVSTFLNPGQTLNDWDSLDAHIWNIGGQNAPIECHDGQYHYGDYDPGYDWGTEHGYTTTGFIRLTERNNFHSQHDPFYPYFGMGLDYNWYHTWTDAYAPPYNSAITLFTGRVRDFYYTLNQASIKAKRTAETALALEFGSSQPYFKQFAISVDGGATVTQAGSAYTWTLHAGTNTIVVNTEDNWSVRGLSSTLTLTY